MELGQLVTPSQYHHGDASGCCSGCPPSAPASDHPPLLTYHQDSVYVLYVGKVKKTPKK